MIVSVSRLLILFHWSTSSLTCSSWTFHKRGDPCYLTQPMYTLTCLQIHIGRHRSKKSEPSQRCKGTNLEARERMWTSRAVSHLWGSLGRWPPSYLCWMSPISPSAPSPTFSTMLCAPENWPIWTQSMGSFAFWLLLGFGQRGAPVGVWRMVRECYSPSSLPLGPNEGNKLLSRGSFHIATLLTVWWPHTASSIHSFRQQI